MRVTRSRQARPTSGRDPQTRRRRPIGTRPSPLVEPVETPPDDPKTHHARHRVSTSSTNERRTTPRHVAAAQSERDHLRWSSLSRPRETTPQRTTTNTQVTGSRQARPTSGARPAVGARGRSRRAGRPGRRVSGCAAAAGVSGRSAAPGRGERAWGPGEWVAPGEPETQNPQPVKRVRAVPRDYCGATGNRTPDLLLAKQALYQLSYGPEPDPHGMKIWWRCKAMKVLRGDTGI